MQKSVLKSPEFDAAITILKHLKEEQSIPDEEFICALKGVLSTESNLVPCKIFQERNVGVLEALVLYMKECKGMRFSEIAKELNRDQRTIWCTYKNAKEKRDKRD